MSVCQKYVANSLILKTWHFLTQTHSCPNFSILSPSVWMCASTRNVHHLSSSLYKNGPKKKSGIVFHEPSTNDRSGNHFHPHSTKVNKSGTTFTHTVQRSTKVVYCYVARNIFVSHNDLIKIFQYNGSTTFLLILWGHSIRKKETEKWWLRNTYPLSGWMWIH